MELMFCLDLLRIYVRLGGVKRGLESGFCMDGWHILGLRPRLGWQLPELGFSEVCRTDRVEEIIIRMRTLDLTVRDVKLSDVFCGTFMLQ